jgi:urocanate hydratase
MLMNNLDPEVAERPEDLVVYGGSGKAARNWSAYDEIVRCLVELGDDETLVVQSGKAVALFPTHEWAPRVVMAAANLVPHWATRQEFGRLEALGLTMYGQMTAGSWMYVGTQALLQTTFETFAAVARKRFDSTLRGTIVLTGGLGGAGGAQPLAITMNGGVAICVDVDPRSIERRQQAGYLDVAAANLEEAISHALEAQRVGRALSVAVQANAAEVVPALAAGGVPIDIVTDQTPAHDPLAYVPIGLDVEGAKDLRRSAPQEYAARSLASMARHVEGMVAWAEAGAEVFEYGNGIRRGAQEGGFDRAFAFPGFVAEYLRPLFCEGRGPFRWVALSGDAEDIHRADEAAIEELGNDSAATRWIRQARERVPFQGLPARVCWLGYGERDRVGLRLNHMVSTGELKAPVVLCRGHEDAGSVASPDRETEGMRDGSDAIADWPVLNALLGVASGATWVTLQDGGGVGIGRSIHAGVAGVADGTPLAAQRLERMLRNDPGLGVIRHADAGYDQATRWAADHGLGMLQSNGGDASARPMG